MLVYKKMGNANYQGNGEASRYYYTQKDLHGREYVTDTQGTQQVLDNAVAESNARILQNEARRDAIMKNSENAKVFKEKFWDPATANDYTAIQDPEYAAWAAQSEEDRQRTNPLGLKARFNDEDNTQALEKFNEWEKNFKNFFDTNTTAKKTLDFYRKRGYNGDELYKKVRFALGQKGTDNQYLADRTGNGDFKTYTDQQKNDIEAVNKLLDQGVGWANLSAQQRSTWLESITDIPAVDARPPVMVVNNPSSAGVSLDNQPATQK
jgi:hypothetical protein